MTDTAPEAEPGRGSPRAHSPSLAGLLSLVLPGIGQLYNRQIVRCLLYASFAIVLWCAGLGWIVHILAGFDGWMAGNRIREWGLVGRSVRAAARCAIEADPLAQSTAKGEPSPAIQSATHREKRADAALHRLAKHGGDDGYVSDDPLGILISLLQIAFVYIEPISYEVHRRRQLRAQQVLRGEE